ncbi:hypothetical protein J5226_11370 [Lysobacter sp. K5869]|uniref:hypothetical protein n=1 Tax=Lysobacter sp. K5869 TaxID=2820808 RepID=UPI001C05FA6E|nr:hypothetical protein [Lysobacter sp. K5869]QWP78942.1 hypothetical protein J5226_11370 [Lysobacter sp. K5869]
MSDRNVALEFFENWLATGMVDSRFFSEDFVYIGGSAIVDAAAWMMNSEVELPMESPVVINTVVDAASTVILFEGIDPVTLLTYRIAWFFQIRERKISRLTDVQQMVHPRSGIAQQHQN